MPWPVTATSEVISSESLPTCLVNTRPTVTSTATLPAVQVVVNAGVRLQVPSNGPGGAGRAGGRAAVSRAHASAGSAGRITGGPGTGSRRFVSWTMRLGTGMTIV